MQSFHDRLRKLMRSRGVSQKAVTQVLKVSRWTVGRWLISKMPNDTQLATLAEYLDTTVEFLVTGSCAQAEHLERCRALYDMSKELTPVQVEAVIAMLESFRAT